MILNDNIRNSYDNHLSMYRFQCIDFYDKFLFIINLVLMIGQGFAY